MATVEIQEGVTSIARATFEGCSSLTLISLPGSLTSIEAYAFEKCSSLASITIPENVTSIGVGAFEGCSSLTSITLPRSLTSIDGSAFTFCSSLASITIPENVTSIGFGEFRGCTSLTSIIVNATRPATVRFDTFDGLDKSACTLYVPAGSKEIYQSAEYWNDFENIVEFGPATNVITYTSTDGQIVTPYNENAFGANIISNTYENGVGTITFDGDVTGIGYNAFYGCSTLASIGDLPACTNIGERAFQGCSSLKSIGNIPKCKTIGSFAFCDCASLTSFTIPASVTEIGNFTFSGCSGIKELLFEDGDATLYLGYVYDNGYVSVFCDCPLETVHLGRSLALITSNKGTPFAEQVHLTTVTTSPSVKMICDYSFQNCISLTSIGDLSACTSIGGYAFRGCTSLTTVGDLSSCTSIGYSAFENCRSLESIGDLSACTNIGNYAFNNCNSMTRLTISSDAIAELASASSIGGVTTVLVQNNHLEEYKNADNWKELSSRIIAIGSEPAVEQTVTMQENTSGLYNAIGEKNLASVIELKVIGDINSYDISIIRNKMPNLHYLDLSEARIRTNEYKYYGDFSTTDDILGDYTFYKLTNLLEVKLPESIQSIGNQAFNQCNYLREICIPSNTKAIGEHAFADCRSLETVHFSPSSKLTSIGYCAFEYCSKLNSFEIPSNVVEIGARAFFCCLNLTELYLPTSLTSVGNNSFTGCTNLREVYVSAPLAKNVTIGDETFDVMTRNQGTLYVPFDEESGWDVTFYSYFWDTQWGSFKNIAKWRPEYDRFPINNDYEQFTGTIPGESIDAQFGTNAGYILGEEAEQKFETAVVKTDNAQSGSIIANGDDNLHIGELYSEIEVEGNRWYFFCFPFDIELSNVTCGDNGRFVFRKYDGEARAESGSGWSNLAADENTLHAGVGYIFQCNKSGTLRLAVNNPAINNADKSPELEAHPAENDQDASWNYVGNPYLAYYQLEDLGFEAPVTYWDGYNYVAVRPGDDDYVFQPYQAFFVQKPTDTQTVGFDGANQQTYTQSQQSVAQARVRRARLRVNPDRLLVNVTLSNGEVSDQTRVVYNNVASTSYEMECDAAKFLSTEAVPQLYTVSGNTKYAINERPHGEVQLGIKAVKAGTYTISMARMDTPMLLKDLKTGITFDFTIGEDYTFQTEAGTFNDRFVLVENPNVNRIENMTIADAENVQFYNLAGQMSESKNDAIQIMKQGETAKKVLIK